MKNKGFTLIELLGVIIVFAALVTIITIASNTVVENSEKKLSDVQIENIEKAANAYYLKEGINNSSDNISFKMCVNLSYLIENDYIENEKVKDPKDNKNLDGSVVITYKSDQYSYKYQDKKCTYEYEALDSICSAVDETTVTTGNIPTGMYNPGDEYICEVKNNTKYHFFLLNTEGDNVNLIMDRNVYYDSTNDIGKVATETNKGLVAWVLGGVNDNNGPLTAMNYLHNATKDWDNIPNMIMNYEDENMDYHTQQKGTSGYGGIKTTGNTTVITSKSNVETGRIENLKARLPRYDEVHGQGKCLTYAENGNKHGSCPLYLANYLENNSYVTGEGLQNISGIYGYWTLSSSNSSGDESWEVESSGIISIGFGYLDDEGYGVRPVISIPKLDISN